MQKVEELKQQFQKEELQEIDPEDLLVEVNSKLSDYHKNKLFIGFLKILLYNNLACSSNFSNKSTFGQVI